MRTTKKIYVTACFLLLAFGASEVVARTSGVRIKELCRLANARDNALVGYGVVTGLAGTGDSARSMASLQSLSNVLKRFGVQIDPKKLHSRNAATVILTSTLPPYFTTGDKIDVNVTSLGDARSLVGGTLMLSHLTGPDGQIYALAQGPVSVGGFRYDMNGNIVQKNHPTSATIPNGATIERSLETGIVGENGDIEFVLNEPDFTTASRVADEINKSFSKIIAKALNPSKISVHVDERFNSNIVGFVTRIENIDVRPDSKAKLVINERTGTVVSGGNVSISKVSVTHGDLKVAISTENIVSQPMFVVKPGDGVKTEVIPKTTIDVTEQAAMAVSLPEGTSVSDLVMALNKINASSRDIITILQSIKSAGALHAELIIR